MSHNLCAVDHEKFENHFLSLHNHTCSTDYSRSRYTGDYCMSINFNDLINIIEWQDSGHDDVAKFSTAITFCEF